MSVDLMRDDGYGKLLKRAKRAIALVLAVLAIGTLSFHYIENYSLTYSLFYASMLATGEGPPTPPVTQAGQLFASIYAFVSVGSTVTALLFIFGPFFGKFLKTEEAAIERDVKKLEGKGHSR